MCRAPNSKRLRVREGQAVSLGSDAASRVWICLQNMDEVLAQTVLETGSSLQLGSWTQTAFPQLLRALDFQSGSSFSF